MACLYFAVIGNPIQHSLSPIIHTLFAEQACIQIEYTKICVQFSNFKQTVQDFFNSGKHGLNITQPFKELAFEMSQVQRAHAKDARSANTLWKKDNRLLSKRATKSKMQGDSERSGSNEYLSTESMQKFSSELGFRNKNNKIYADNTDGIGLITDLNRHIDLTDKNILILGAGGAARGIIGPLLNSSAKSVTIFNRTKQKADNLKDFFQNRINVCDKLLPNYDIIINATSANIQNQALEIPDTVIMHASFCYDLAYDLYKPTIFKEQSLKIGTKAEDGLGMLIEQAAQSFNIWHGFMPAIDLKELIPKIIKLHR